MLHLERSDIHDRAARHSGISLNEHHKDPETIFAKIDFTTDPCKLKIMDSSKADLHICVIGAGMQDEDQRTAR